MVLKSGEVAAMLDLSCVRTNSCEVDIKNLAYHAKKYQCGHVSVLQCFVPYMKELLLDSPQVGIVGNVSFPSGSDSTSVKVFQTRELVKEGCNEIDMVINVGMLCSGKYREVEADVRAVVEAAEGHPVKVIIEVPYLDRTATVKACEICINSKAHFVKTGTGWTTEGTKLDDVKLINATTGDAIKIKVSGGIRSLGALTDFYNAGARRFGVNMLTGIGILEECIAGETGECHEPKDICV